MTSPVAVLIANIIQNTGPAKRLKRRPFSISTIGRPPSRKIERTTDREMAIAKMPNSFLLMNQASANWHRNPSNLAAALAPMIHTDPARALSPISVELPGGATGGSIASTEVSTKESSRATTPLSLELCMSSLTEWNRTSSAGTSSPTPMTFPPEAGARRYAMKELVAAAPPLPGE